MVKEVYDFTERENERPGFVESGTDYIDTPKSILEKRKS
jgi:hypothetical protein